MARQATKTVALGVATTVLGFGVNQLAAGDTTTGGVALAAGAILLAGYQLAEESDHGKAYDDVVGAIGADTFKRLSELGADELDRLSHTPDRDPETGQFTDDEA